MEGEGVVVHYIYYSSFGSQCTESCCWVSRLPLKPDGTGAWWNWPREIRRRRHHLLLVCLRKRRTPHSQRYAPKMVCSKSSLNELRFGTNIPERDGSSSYVVENMAHIGCLLMTTIDTHSAPITGNSTSSTLLTGTGSSGSFPQTTNATVTATGTGVSIASSHSFTVSANATTSITGPTGPLVSASETQYTTYTTICTTNGSAVVSLSSTLYFQYKV